MDPEDVLPPITAYYIMHVGTLPLIPYDRPGDLKLAEAVRAMAHKHHAVLLANHGPVVAGNSLSAAGAAIKELEETARFHQSGNAPPHIRRGRDQIARCGWICRPNRAVSTATVAAPPPPIGGMESTSISLDVGGLQNLAKDIAPQLAKLLSGASPEFELKLKLKSKPAGDLSEVIAMMQKADPNWKIRADDLATP